MSYILHSVHIATDIKLQTLHIVSINNVHNIATWWFVVHFTAYVVMYIHYVFQSLGYYDGGIHLPIYT